MRGRLRGRRRRRAAATRLRRYPNSPRLTYSYIGIYPAAVTLPTDEQILISREFDAPRHLVYRALTEPELVKRWWHAKRGRITAVEIDLRVGGAWRYAMVADDGMEVAFHGTYREIVPD